MDQLFDLLHQHDVEQVVVVHHRESGLRGFIVIHDTSLGPAVGGTRLLPVKSLEAALSEAIRSAHAATDTLALAGIPAGGAAAVLINHDGLSRTDALTVFAAHVRTLGGRFITWRDEGLTRQDAWRLHAHCEWFADERLEGLGDLEAAAALSVAQSILGALEANDRPIALQGMHVVLQHLVGRGGVLARVLAQAGASITASDETVAGDRVARELGVATITPEEVFELPSDIVVLTSVTDEVFAEDTLDLLRGRIICDASTRPDLPASKLRELQELEITWVPGFLCNAGPLIVVAGHTLTGRKNWDTTILAMRETTRELLRESRETGVPADELARKKAKKLLRRPRTANDIFLPHGLHPVAHAHAHDKTA
ncbi:MAG: Glu/Leu/Phe/Val dehydrogenase dimerization domain-containing protein [Planctomycetota bacterium]